MRSVQFRVSICYISHALSNISSKKYKTKNSQSTAHMTTVKFKSVLKIFNNTYPKTSRTNFMNFLSMNLLIRIVRIQDGVRLQDALLSFLMISIITIINVLAVKKSIVLVV